MATTSRQIRHQLRGAVLIDEAWLRAWFEKLAQLNLGKVDVSVSTEGKRLISDLTPAELLALRNGKGDRIENLTVKARRKYHFDAPQAEEPLSVYLNTDAASTLISVDGSERDVAWADGIIQASLVAMKPWYHKIARLTLVLQIIIGFSMLIGVYTIPISLADAGVLPEAVALISWPMLFIAAGIAAWFGLAIVILKATDSMTNQLFPPFQVLIGDGVKRDERLSELRKTLFWSVLIALAVTIVGAGLSKLFGFI